MTSVQDLERRIQEKLAVSEERLRLRQNHTGELMRAAEKAHAAFTATADRLIESVIRPRMTAVKAQLDGVAAPELDCTRHACCLQLAHIPRFPATVRLDLGVTRDGDMRTLIVQYRLRIIPIFFPFEGADDLTFPIDRVEPERVALWLDDKLVAFVETYLRLELEQGYQDENRVIDPVCCMSVNRVDAPARAEYGGKTYYFCVSECRDRFVANPERYVPHPPGVR
jgi:YHS domain-containing protein